MSMEKKKAGLSYSKFVRRLNVYGQPWAEDNTVLILYLNYISDKYIFI